MNKPRGILLGMAALAVGIGVAAAGVGHLLRSVPTAQAAEGVGPTVTGGVHPWVSLAGVTDGAASDTVVYSVPADRVFILTGGCVSGTTATLQQGGVERMHWLTRILRCDDVSTDQDNGPNLLREGNAHVVFDPGSDVVVHHDAAQVRNYYLEGYLAHP